MPIYEYVCEKCGHHLEVLQKMSDAPLAKCTECKGKLEKVFSQTSFQLKGSGWYVTDYGKTGGKSKETKSTPDKGEKKETSTSAATGTASSASKTDK